jgi:S1-C subfamily serine protease
VWCENPFRIAEISANPTDSERGCKQAICKFSIRSVCHKTSINCETFVRTFVSILREDFWKRIVIRAGLYGVSTKSEIETDQALQPTLFGSFILSEGLMPFAADYAMISSSSSYEHRRADTARRVPTNIKEYRMADVLQTLSDAMAEAVEAAGASVVQVAARRRLPASGVVWSADGVIVTSHHVIENDEKIRIGLPNGESVSATLVGRDPSTDLAVLRAEASGLTVPNWAELNEVRVGHLGLALGRPGDSVQATLGVVSALSHSDNDQKYFAQTDVVMYPGFSGGPLVGVTGQVLGLNSSALMRGVSLAVQTPTIRFVVENLLTHGKMRRGYLGVGVQPARLPAALAEQLGQKTGALVVSVETDSPADKGGLFMGDTIVALDGHSIEDMDSLLASLSGAHIGATVPVRIVRGGQVQEVSVTIGERA